MARLDQAIRREALRASQLFHGLGEAELDAVLAVAKDADFHAGQRIFGRGDPGSSMMAVLSGRVRISTTSSDGKEVTLNTIMSGGIFGEIALLDGKARSADAVAIERTKCVVVDRAHLLPLLCREEALLGRLLAILCGRLRHTSMALEHMATAPTDVRLASVLLNLAEIHGIETDAGLRLRVRISQTELGKMIGMTRETVNKQMKRWKVSGVMGDEHGYMLLARPRALQEIVGSA